MVSNEISNKRICSVLFNFPFFVMIIFFGMTKQTVHVFVS